MSSICRASYTLSLLAGIGCVLFVASSHAQDSVDSGDQNPLTKRELLQAQLTEQESTLGRHNPALIETLTSLANASVQLNFYEEASALLDQALQVQRLNLGLYTPEQLPLLLEKMRVDARGSNWNSVNETLEYLRWLLLEKQVREGDTLVEDLIAMAEIHLQGVEGDGIEQQAHHYQQAFDLTLEALSAGEKHWDSPNPRRLELYYSLLKQNYLHSEAVERGDDTAYALRAVIPGSKWVRPRHIARERYYRAGLRLLNGMRRIIANEEKGSSEALTMVDLYIADWHLLFDREQSRSAYEKVFRDFLAADVNSIQLNTFFSTPRILPVPDFHRSVASALVNTPPDSSMPLANEGNSDLLSFPQWRSSMSSISKPTATGLQEADLDQSVIRLQFRLDPLSEVSHWIGGRYRTNLGVAENFELIGAGAPPDFDADLLEDRIRLLHFRPQLENGEIQTTEASMFYYKGSISSAP